MKFYTFKQIYLTLGISANTLRNRIKNGIYPPLDLKNKHLPRSVGYFEENFKRVAD